MNLRYSNSFFSTLSLISLHPLTQNRRLFDFTQTWTVRVPPLRISRDGTAHCRTDTFLYTLERVAGRFLTGADAPAPRRRWRDRSIIVALDWRWKPRATRHVLVAARLDLLWIFYLWQSFPSPGWRSHCRWRVRQVRKWHPLGRTRCERSSATASPSEGTARSRRCVIEARVIDSDRDDRWGDHVERDALGESETGERNCTRRWHRVFWPPTRFVVVVVVRRRRTSTPGVASRGRVRVSSTPHRAARAMLIPLLMLGASSFPDAVSHAARDTSLGNYSALRWGTAVSFTQWGRKLADSGNEFCRRC